MGVLLVSVYAVPYMGLLVGGLPPHLLHLLMFCIKIYIYLSIIIII